MTPPPMAETDATERLAASWIAVDAQSRRVLEVARKVASTDSTILIRGESGTGKDLLAQIIHFLGPRREEPYLKIDCASLPVELLESELFGHEKGAFTGASTTKRGRLEMAGCGTIVLDEVAALMLPMQAKLLRVLEEKRFERLGGVSTYHIEARLIALTNADLERGIAERHFREDLYFRLNVVPIVLPPLRERRADIAPLAEHLLATLAERHARPHARWKPEALDAMTRYDWPGNVRELKHLIERAILLSDASEFGCATLPARIVREPGTAAPASLEEIEKRHIALALDYTRGKKARAAEILGISRKTLLEKRKKYGLL